MMRAALVLALFALAACGSVLPKPPAPLPLYRLTPLPPAANAAAVDVQLAVDPPVASASLDTERIALMANPLRINYFADSAWSDRAPEMIQSLVIESLANAGRIRVVTRPSGEVRADAELMIDLERFDAEYRGGDLPEVHVRLVCRLVHDRNAIAVRTFDATARPAHNDTPDIVEAFDTAFHAVLVELAPWTADQLAAMKP
jgi:cholesterol transport system auxiliary component